MKRNDKSADAIISEIGNSCLLMRSRLISRIITAAHDEELLPLGIGSAQFALLVVIFKLQPVTRADIGRYHHQDRSTLTRNLKIILSNHWAEEVDDEAGGRGRPIMLTDAGKELLVAAEPAWRKGQAKAKAMLGKEGAVAIANVANEIMKRSR